MADKNQAGPSEEKKQAATPTPQQAEEKKQAATPTPQQAEEKKQAAAEAEAPRRRNLTRESLEMVLAARYALEGKPDGEAKGLARKRAAEMIVD